MVSMLPADAADQRRRDTLARELEPIASLIADPRVLDILLNADGAVWIDRAGEGMTRTGVHVRSAEAESLLKTIAASVRRELTPQAPSLQAEIAMWHLRVQAAIPPIVDAPVFAFRKPASVVWPLEHYAETGILPTTLDAQPSSGASGWAGRWLRKPQVYRGATLIDKLRHAVADRANILVGGGTGSGKTTFANAVLQEISRTGDRVYLVEDTRELRCTSANHVSVRICPGTYGWRDAVVDALRLRPDRIVVGEVRDGGAALELLKAWNTGHRGGLATIHADDPASMLERLCQLTEEVVPHAPRRLIADAVNVLVHLERDIHHPAGRRVAAVSLVEGVGPNGSWQLSPL
jgi:Flp pilus assembly CpaF family ATPase